MIKNFMKGLTIDNLSLLFRLPLFINKLKNDQQFITDVADLVYGKNEVKQIGFGILLMKIGCLK